MVEPHIAPFFFSPRGSAGLPTLHRSGRGWRGGFVSAMLEGCIKLDMKKWLQLLHDFKLMPKFFGADFSAVFLQENLGSVTIVPSFGISALLRLTSDPDRGTMEKYILEGERATWPKLAMVRNRRLIEIELAAWKKAHEGGMGEGMGEGMEEGMGERVGAGGREGGAVREEGSAGGVGHEQHSVQLQEQGASERGVGTGHTVDGESADGLRRRGGGSAGIVPRRGQQQQQQQQQTAQAAQQALVDGAKQRRQQQQHKQEQGKQLEKVREERED
jgi:hypothetical protein